THMNEYLASVDSTDRYSSGEFVHQHDLALIKGLKAELETLVGYPLEGTAPEIFQDGSRFTELSVVASLLRKDGTAHGIALCAFEFSNFGRLFTFRDHMQFPFLPPAVVAVARQRIENEGFRFASYESLQEEYHGICRGLCAGATVYDRFFFR